MWTSHTFSDIGLISAHNGGTARLLRLADD